MSIGSYTSNLPKQNMQFGNFNGSQDTSLGQLRNDVVSNVPVARVAQNEVNEAKENPLASIVVPFVGGIAGWFAGKKFIPTMENGKYEKVINFADRYNDQYNKFAKHPRVESFFKNISDFVSKPFKGNNIEIFKVASQKASVKGVLQEQAKSITTSDGLAKILENLDKDAKKTIVSQVAKVEGVLDKSNAAKTALNSLKDISEKSRKAITKSLTGIESAQKSLDIVEKAQGPLGKAAGKAGLILKRELSGIAGVFNGLLAASTVHNVMQAKKGEKLSTFMQDFLGLWVGSIVGFRMFESAFHGLKAVAESPKAVNGLLPKLAKVAKIPGGVFIIPLAGAILAQTILEKVSHKVFGKPTEKELKVIKNPDEFNDYLSNHGYNSQLSEPQVLQAPQLNQFN